MKFVYHYSNNLFKTYYLTTIILILTLSCSELKTQNKEMVDMDLIAKEMVSKIQTDIDSQFIYEYEQSKFVPPNGKTLLIMGQTVERITEYVNQFPNQPIPGGWAAYWGIPEFNGVKEAHRNNEVGNTQNHQMLIDEFPNTVVQSAMWMVGRWDVAKKTGDGDYDEVIEKYSNWAKSADRPIYLRIGYEFDGPHNELEPEEYVRAYKHIVDLMRAKGVENIAYVWHSYASPPFKDYPLSAWYPGDDYVDWVAISLFGNPYDSTDFGPDCDTVLQFAKEHKKPVMIAESSAIKGIDKENYEVWDQWFVNFFTFTYLKNIKAISFINEDWTTIRIKGIEEWKDSRLYNNSQVSKAWFEETNNDRYLKQSIDLFQQLGYEK